MGSIVRPPPANADSEWDVPLALSETAAVILFAPCQLVAASGPSWAGSQGASTLLWVRSCSPFRLTIAGHLART